MVRPQHELSHLQGALIQWSGLYVLGAVFQIVSCLIQQMCCFWEAHVPLFDMCSAFQCMGQAPLTKGPGIDFNLGKDVTHGTHNTLSPLTPSLALHLVFQYCLYKAMDGERVGIGISLDKRISEQFAQGFIQLEWINRSPSKR